MRLLSGLIVSGLAALALAGTATAAPRGVTIDRGVVQLVTSSRIVLRELDGSTVSLTVGARTRVLLNGLPAVLSDIQPGFVAGVAHNGSAPARVVRAFGRIQSTVATGVVVSASQRTIVIRTAGGQTLTFRVTARTKIRWRGVPVTMAAVRAGRTVEVAHTKAGEALRIAVRLRRTV